MAIGLLVGTCLALLVPLPSLPSLPVLAATPPHLWSAVSLGACVLLVLAAGVSVRARREPMPSGMTWRVLTGAMAMAWLAGTLLATAAVAQQSLRHWPESLANTEWIVEGQILGPPVRAERYVRFDLGVQTLRSADGHLRPEYLPQRVRVSSSAVNAGLQSGQIWRMTLRVRPPVGRLNEGGFDTRAWLVGDRVQALATHRVRAPSRQLAPQATMPFAARVGHWRDHRRAAVMSLPSLDRNSAAVISALAIGLGDAVPTELRDTLQATGTAHLLAISGLHVSLLFAGVLMLLRFGLRISGWLRLYKTSTDAPYRLVKGSYVTPDPDQACALMALAAAGVYAVCAGFELPVQRALLMLAVGVAVLLRRRQSSPANVLALAVIGVLLLDPLAVLGAGFWLSAGAVAVILWLQVGRRVRHPAIRVVSIQWTIGLAMLVPGAWWFGEVSLISPLANLIAVPWATILIVPAALMVTLLAESLPVVADLLASAVGLAITGLFKVLRTLEQIPGAHQPASLPGSIGLLAALSAVLLATFPGRRIWVGFVPILLMPVAVHAWRGAEIKGAELHVLDVGHGLAALVLTESSTVLIDTGGGSRPMGNNRGKEQKVARTRLETDVLPYLLALGRRQVDHLVLSHADHDHAAGLQPLLARQQAIPIHASDTEHVDTVMSVSGVVAAPGQVSRCEAGKGFSLGGLRYDFLHPGSHDRGDRNNRSCVLLVHGEGVRLLLPGDIEADAERRLVARTGQLPVDVLIAPHHGSDSSSTREFVDAFPANEVVFPAARYSQWGFPHTMVQMRYKLSGARLHHTGRAGALVFRFPGGLSDDESVSYSRKNQRLWRAPLVGVASIEPPVVIATDDDP